MRLFLWFSNTVPLICYNKMIEIQVDDLRIFHLLRAFYLLFCLFSYGSSKYSATKIRNIMLSFSTVGGWIALALSLMVCHTSGKGDEMICKIGTPASAPKNIQNLLRRLGKNSYLVFQRVYGRHRCLHHHLTDLQVHPNVTYPGKFGDDSHFASRVRFL